MKKLNQEQIGELKHHINNPLTIIGLLNKECEKTQEQIRKIADYLNQLEMESEND